MNHLPVPERSDLPSLCSSQGRSNSRSSLAASSVWAEAVVAHTSASKAATSLSLHAWIYGRVLCIQVTPRPQCRLARVRASVPSPMTERVRHKRGAIVREHVHSSGRPGMRDDSIRGLKTVRMQVPSSLAC